MSATAVDEITITKHESASAAFVAALGELTNPKATERAETGQYGYSYAKLASTLDLVRPTFARHELAIVQPVQSFDDGQLAIETRVLHSSGESICSGYLVVRMPPNPQQTGSTITYLRRYQLCALLGIAADDDDDGRAASPVTAPARRRASPAQERVARDTTQPQARPVAAITDAQRRHIMAMFNALGLNGDAMRDARLRYTSDAIGREIETTNEITRDEARTLIEQLIIDTRDDDDDEGTGYQ